MKWIEPNRFSKSYRNPIFGQMFGHQRAEIDARNTKMNRGQVTHPIWTNFRYEMNWANSFFPKRPGNLVYRSMDRWTQKPVDGQTSGWVQHTPIPPSVGQGCTKVSWVTSVWILPAYFCFPKKQSTFLRPHCALLLLRARTGEPTWSPVWPGRQRLCLTHLSLVPYICIGELGQHWFK